MIEGMAIYRHSRRDNSKPGSSVCFRLHLMTPTYLSSSAMGLSKMAPTQHSHMSRVIHLKKIIRREKEKVRRISSIGEFANLPHDSGPGEDYVWRTLEYCYAPVSQDTDQEVRSFIRALMRQQAISLEELTTSQIDYLDLLPLPVPASLTWNVTEKLSNAIKQIKEYVFVSERGRNLFKTQQGMLGLGHKSVQAGDTPTKRRDLPIAMQFLSLLVLLAPVASSCGDNTYRCKNPDKSTAEEQAVTTKICSSLGNGYCYCNHRAEWFCDTFGEDINKFKKSCEDQGENWYWVDC
ncbi:Uncharacterized protein HZ326_14498 [Fusarium oxysporum f. sp. albedinis]|nr:Uncharacterized protein HZ326_14498 [Fusarium oxysporum f. sp. albedinis]